MNKIRRSIALLKASNTVVRTHPSMLVYPVITAVAVLLTLGLITAPIIGGSAFLLDRAGLLPAIDSTDSGPWYFALISAVAFLAVSFVSILFSATTFLAAESALNGEKPSFRKAFGMAWAKRKNIFKWTLFAASVGYLMQLAYEKLSWLGIFAKVGAIIAGLAWALAVVFIVPVLVKNDIGPIEALKRSAGLLKRAWGEQLTAGFSLTLFNLFVALFFLITPGIALGALVFSDIISLGVALAIGAVVFCIFLLLALYITALQNIFTAALYRYAETGDYVGPFSPEMFHDAFRSKLKK